MSSDLKSCPFCGGVPRMEYIAGDWGYTHSAAIIRCGGCDAQTASYMGRDDNDETVKDSAIAAWNTRAEDEAKLLYTRPYEVNASTEAIKAVTTFDLSAQRITALSSQLEAVTRERNFLDDRIQKVEREREQMRQALPSFLALHWLTDLCCDHEAHTDEVLCYCGWRGPKQPTVGDAVKTWAEHVSAALSTPQAQGEGKPLGVCDTQSESIPHTQCKECINWRPTPPASPEKGATDEQR